MHGRTAFQSFTEFRDEVLRLRAGPLTSAVDDIVDDLFHVGAEEEREPLWDDQEE